MKLLLLYEGPIVGATWVGDYHEARINISNGQYLCADLLGESRFKYPLLNLLSGDIYVNSELKIRFQKTPQSQHFLTCLSFLSGLNEFHE